MSFTFYVVRVRDSRRLDHGDFWRRQREAREAVQRSQQDLPAGKCPADVSLWRGADVLCPQPTAEDDYTDYTCEARHEALPLDMPLRVTVQLSVLCE